MRRVKLIGFYAVFRSFKDVVLTMHLSEELSQVDVFNLFITKCEFFINTSIVTIMNCLFNLDLSVRIV